MPERPLCWSGPSSRLGGWTTSIIIVICSRVCLPHQIMASLGCLSELSPAQGQARSKDGQGLFAAGQMRMRSGGRGGPQEMGLREGREGKREADLGWGMEQVCRTQTGGKQLRWTSFHLLSPTRRAHIQGTVGPSVAFGMWRGEWGGVNKGCYLQLGHRN